MGGNPAAYLAGALLPVIAVVLLAMLVFEPGVVYRDAYQHLMMGRHMAEGDFEPRLEPSRTPRYTAMDIGLRDGREVRFWKYPPGVALLLVAPAVLLGGPEAALYINPVLCVVILLLFNHLCQRLVGGWTAAAGVMLVMMNPLWPLLGPSYLSHRAVSLLLVASLILLVRTRETGSWRSGLLYGLLVGLVPSVRYPEAVIVPALALPMIVMSLRGRLPRRALFGFLAGMALPLALLGVYNMVAFGSPLTTGYSLSEEQSAFGLSYLGTNSGIFFTGLLSDMGAHVILLAVCGVTLLLRRGGERLLAASLALPFLMSVTLYASFKWEYDGRYFLPFVYPVVLSVLLALEWLQRNARKLLAPMLAGALALSAAAAGEEARVLLVAEEAAGSARAACDMVRGAVPDGSVVVTHPSLAWTLDFLGDYEILDAGLMVDSPGALDSLMPMLRGSPLYVLVTGHYVDALTFLQGDMLDVQPLDSLVRLNRGWLRMEDQDLSGLLWSSTQKRMEYVLLRVTPLSPERVGGVADDAGEGDGVY